MKPFSVLLLALAAAPLLAQGQSDNYSFMKLYVTNDQGEVLLVKWNGEWELSGDRYNQPLSVSKFLDEMASHMGIKIKNPRLCGLYTQRWRGNPYLTLMHYYQADYVSGELQVPPDCTDVKWFSYEEALKVIPYSNMTAIMKEIKAHPGKVIGAAFERYKDDNNQTQFVTLEDWHLMN
jgi:hypothetical protein